MRIIIDGRNCEAEPGEYILAVAKRNGIDIPTLCSSDALPGIGSCRICVVELIERNKTRVVASCIYPITHEAEVITNSQRIIGIRKTIMKLLLSRAPENEHLSNFAKRYGLWPSELLNAQEEECILCGLCTRACEELGANAISTVGRGTDKKVSTPYDEPSAVCIGCGSCAAVCATKVIKAEEVNGTRKIWGKTFELLRCKRCGEHYAPREYIDFMEKKLGEKSEGDYCSSCRKVMQAEKFRDIYRI